MLSAALLSVLDRFGQSVCLQNENGETLAQGRAFLQPVLERSEEKPQLRPSPLGTIRRDRFLCLAHPSLPLDRLGSGRLVAAGCAYKILTLQPVRLGDALSHWWCLLKFDGEVDHIDGLSL